MRDRLEFFKGEKSARSLERVDRAEDTGQRVLRARIFFQHEEIAFELVEILPAFDEEFPCQIVHRSGSRRLHPRSLFNAHNNCAPPLAKPF